MHQEILLAPRVLYLTPLCLSWRFSSLCAGEKDEELIDSPIPQVMSFRSLALEAFSTPPDSAWANQAYRKRLLVHDFWHLIFRDHPKGGLTYSGNRVVAISGLAKETQNLMRKPSITPFKHVSGLWMCCFNFGLLSYVLRAPRENAIRGLMCTHMVLGISQTRSWTCYRVHAGFEDSGSPPCEDRCD